MAGSDKTMREIYVFHPESEADKATALKNTRSAGIRTIENVLERSGLTRTVHYADLAEDIREDLDDLLGALGIRDAIEAHNPVPHQVPAAS